MNWAEKRIMKRWIDNIKGEVLKDIQIYKNFNYTDKYIVAEKLSRIYEEKEENPDLKNLVYYWVTDLW